MKRDARTPEHREAIVRCRFCDQSWPKYRKYDGEERLDVPRMLRDHVRYGHPEQAAMTKRMDEEMSENYRKRREASRIAGREY